MKVGPLAMRCVVAFNCALLAATTSAQGLRGASFVRSSSYRAVHTPSVPELHPEP